MTVLLTLVALLALAYAVGPRPRIPRLDPALPPVPPEPLAAEAWLAAKEAALPLRPDNQARVAWAGAPGEKKPRCLVYLHGYSASWREGAPVIPDTARRYGANLLLTRLRSTTDHGALGMVVEGGRVLWLKPKNGRSADMPVVPLHEGILKNVPLENISYGQDPRELVQNLQRGEAGAVFLLPPPDKEAFARICKAGRLLPQKSTYFYPKLATGFLMRSLEGDL